MSIDGTAFINPLVFCDVPVEIADQEQHSMVRETVRIGYYPNRRTRALEEQLQAFFASDDGMDEEEYKAMLYPAFLRFVGWWDVKRDGAMWPLTEIDIQPMALQYISALLFAALRHARTGKTTPGEAPREDSPEQRKSAPLSASSEAMDARTTSPAESSPVPTPITRSQKRSPASNPGNGGTRRLSTTKPPASGSRRNAS